jgi:hypothetical protein
MNIKNERNKKKLQTFTKILIITSLVALKISQWDEFNDIKKDQQR